MWGYFVCRNTLFLSIWKKGDPPVDIPVFREDVGRLWVQDVVEVNADTKLGEGEGLDGETNQGDVADGGVCGGRGIGEVVARLQKRNLLAV